MREDEHKKAVIAMKSNRGGSPTPEQKSFRDKVKEMRTINGTGNEIKLEEEDDAKDRQPALGKHSNKYDLKIFQDAQAVASEAIVSAFVFILYSLLITLHMLISVTILFACLVRMFFKPSMFIYFNYSVPFLADV